MPGSPLRRTSPASSHTLHRRRMRLSDLLNWSLPFKSPTRYAFRHRPRTIDSHGNQRAGTVRSVARNITLKSRVSGQHGTLPTGCFRASSLREAAPQPKASRVGLASDSRKRHKEARCARIIYRDSFRRVSVFLLRTPKVVNSFLARRGGEHSTRSHLSSQELRP